jgi:peptide/nickel transport system substrate-binding protein
MLRKALALAIVLAACVGLSPRPAAAAELNIGFGSDPLTLDPANHRSRDTETIIRMIYSGLAANAAEKAVVPNLAKSWRWVDPKTLEVTLRQGVTFQDGSPLTADDVVFSFERILTPGAIAGQSSPRKGLLGPVTAVTKVDDRTVRFLLSEPWPVLPAMLTFQEVVSKAFAEKVGAAGLATQADGSGPFRLVEWRRGDSLVLERYAGSFGGPEQGPSAPRECVDRLIVKIIPENSARVAALLAGDVDLINDLPAHDIRTVEANPNTRVAAVNGTRTFFVALNNNKKLFNDLRVREAANYAMDRKLIIDRILNGRAVELNGVLSPAAFGFDPNLPAYGYHPDKAKALLAQAGYPNGVDVTLDTDGPQKDIAEAIGSLLTKVGIRTTVRVGAS